MILKELLLPLLLLQLGHAESKVEHSLSRGFPKKRPTRSAEPHQPDDFVMKECLKKQYTRLSCAKVFCPPWQRCISGQCVCRIPYQCPLLGTTVCGMEGIMYMSLCRAQSTACRSKKPVFSHYGQNCEDDNIFETHLKEYNGKLLVQVKTVKGEALLCGDLWDATAANVVCRHKKGDPRGAADDGRMMLKDADAGRWPSKCMSVRCSGHEHSLAECILYEPQPITSNTKLAVVRCYEKEEADKDCSGFRCANQKCIQEKFTCDGVDHCGDYSDEMCCTGCRGGAFHCKSGVCIPPHAVRDGIRNCLGGEDELDIQGQDSKLAPAALMSAAPASVWSNPKDDIREVRNFTENQLQCGIPNMDYIYKTEEEMRRNRRKRVVGGEEALPTQIQWQVALFKDGRFHCGGVFLGGCWVLTSAQCVRSSPQAYLVKLSLWKTTMVQATTDAVRVKSVIVHHGYNRLTQQNDIALLQLAQLPHSEDCFTPNPAVRPVCLPWSTLQFLPGDNCIVSGWGRSRAGYSSHVLKWANVTITENCQSYYKDRFYEGMECASDPEGEAGTCRGDSGGPLVCTDASGVSYVWGIVSADGNCRKSEAPDLYTKVAHYFEWIRFYIGWRAVTKYN